jgi:two-component system nitrogen regulation sensor histidine kinase GlnL
MDEEQLADIAAALPLPLLIVGRADEIRFVNPAAEEFFGSGASTLARKTFGELVAPGSPLPEIVTQARARGISVVEHDVPISITRSSERVVDVSASPLSGGREVLVVLHERSFARRLGRQLPQQGALRSLDGMAAVLAHEIKNPLAGIRGAAQLLEESLDEDGRSLTRLICEESDRIRALIDRMESFGDMRPVPFAPVNIHEVLDRAQKLAQSGFARHVVFTATFDPSLPQVQGDRDQLIQLFVNLVRNASDAVPERGGEIALATAFRAGLRVRTGPEHAPRGLPLEVTVRDNGSGISPELMPHIFDPFVTTRPRGTGLGLALAAKIASGHGGVIECESAPGRTLFRVLLPAAQTGGDA